ncbi:hypothetical protein SODALDRAFT_200611 [Sodiomyces alkalinus F11]|uniref:Uncharacterized protein n=1 Tax=Sodiomyces alkalinus (strain CBS 110278 / VKM F-3762 / F11) TaxID=1314773 RepID=A0A3N2PSZ0_SODAK|nr:hypothetical protein SODALDRAFT_200611 [Sodiomyces alkalinus F11]ROT37588.1 hypothetical protein SODALDRAFT_200611 [Sodiomyces alkalinus F11]
MGNGLEETNDSLLAVIPSIVFTLTVNLARDDLDLTVSAYFCTFRPLINSPQVSRLERGHLRLSNLTPGDNRPSTFQSVSRRPHPPDSCYQLRRLVLFTMRQSKSRALSYPPCQSNTSTSSRPSSSGPFLCSRRLCFLFSLSSPLPLTPHPENQANLFVQSIFILAVACHALTWSKKTRSIPNSRSFSERHGSNEEKKIEDEQGTDCIPGRHDAEPINGATEGGRVFFSLFTASPLCFISRHTESAHHP